MSGSFKFIKDTFPEIAEDGKKAKSYLKNDAAACMLYISRVLDGVVKTVCREENISLKSDGQDRTLSELIDELADRRIIDRKILRTMHNMRIFRNKNAHNEDTSFKENTRLLKKAVFLCRWLKKNYGNTSGEQEPHSHIRISITDIMSEYKQDSSAASRKYEGKTITLTGGKILKVTQAGYGDNALVVSLLSSAEKISGMMTTTYKVDCYFPSSLQDKVNTLKTGQNFTATGIWRNRRLVNCVWHSEGTKRFRQKAHRRSEWSKDKAFFFWIAIIIAAISIIYHLITKGL